MKMKLQQHQNLKQLVRGVLFSAVALIFSVSNSFADNKSLGIRGLCEVVLEQLGGIAKRVQTTFISSGLYPIIKEAKIRKAEETPAALDKLALEGTPRNLPDLLEFLQEPLPKVEIKKAERKDGDYKKQLLTSFGSAPWMLISWDLVSPAVRHIQFQEMDPDGYRLVSQLKYREKAQSALFQICRRHLSNPQLIEMLRRFDTLREVIHAGDPALFHSIVISGENMGFELRQEWDYWESSE